MDYFEGFMKGFTAGRLLQNRASKNGSFIKYVCLASSLIDASLRIGLILKRQLENKNSSIDRSLLFQDITDPKISERTIYRRSFQEGIIDQGLFNELNSYYDQRNIIIHRFIISSYTYNDIFNVGMEYERLVEQVSDAVNVLENKQIETRIGMTTEGPPLDEHYYYDFVKEKIANNLVLNEIRLVLHDNMEKES